MTQVFSPKTKNYPSLAALFALLALTSNHVFAQHVSIKHGHERPHGSERYVFRGHETRHFPHQDLIRWRSGHWNNSCLHGRCGWWWLAAGQWYFYERPIYPYPLVVSNVEFVEPTYVAPLPAYVYKEATPVPTPIPAPAPVTGMTKPLTTMPLRGVAAPPQFWYYCDNPQGYFPDVQTCAVPFRQVPPPPPPQ